MRFKDVAQTLVSIGIAFCVIQLLWWQFEPITPAISVNESQSVGWETTTKPGGSVSRLLEFTANRDVLLYTSRRSVELECDRCKVYELEHSQKYYVAGETYRQVRSVNIPLHVQPGRYRMEVDARWEANPIREGRMVIPPFVITVVAP
jgi:hypothetical protein